MADSDTSRVGRQRKKRTFFSPETVPHNNRPAKRGSVAVKDVDVGDQSLRLSRLKARLNAIPDKPGHGDRLRRRQVTNRDSTVFLLDLFERAIADPVVLQRTLGLTTNQSTNEEQPLVNGSVNNGSLQQSSAVHVKMEPTSHVGEYQLTDDLNEVIGDDKPETGELRQLVTSQMDHEINPAKYNVESTSNEEPPTQCVSSSGRPLRKAAELLTKKLTPWWKEMEQSEERNIEALEPGEVRIVNQDIDDDDADDDDTDTDSSSGEEWEVKPRKQDEDDDFCPDNERDDDSEDNDRSEFSDSSDAYCDGQDDEDVYIDDNDLESRAELKQNFEHHYKIAEDGWFACLLCTGKYRCKQPQSLLKHYQLHKDQKLNCDICNFVAGNIIGLRNHRISHGPKNFRCEVCHKRFFDKDASEKHFMRYHTPENEKTYVCPLPDCNKRYVLKKDLSTHLSNHPGDKMCHVCGNHYTTTVSLRRHIMNVHEKDKSANKIVCEICGKQYAASSQHVFRIHMMRHRNEKPYTCHFCGKAFCAQKFVLEHERTHTGEKPYKCGKCDFVAAKKAQVNSHMKTHTGVKPFKCKLCKYASTWNIQLKTHMAAHSSLTVVSCEICDIMFINNKSLNIHNKKYHKNKQGESQSSENEAACSN